MRTTDDSDFDLEYINAYCNEVTVDCNVYLCDSRGQRAKNHGQRRIRRGGRCDVNLLVNCVRVLGILRTVEEFSTLDSRI